MIHTSRNQRRALLRENLGWPIALREIPREQWPSPNDACARVWRSSAFLVQEYKPTVGGVIRLSVNRTIMRGDGRWDDGISWDELQKIKQETGHGDRFAVEVYPSDDDVVNVGNLRHLWILPEPPAFAWRRT